MLTTTQIEFRLAEHFGYRRNIIVPNISRGINIHECDLFIVSNSGYTTEVEIKISKQDLINDKKKKHLHISNRIKKLYFAIPKALEQYIEHIPERAGVIIVAEKRTYKNGFRKGVKVLREAQINSDCRKLSEKEIDKVLRLGVMRVWNLKKKLDERAENDCIISK